MKMFLKKEIAIRNVSSTPIYPIESSISCVELLDIEFFPFFPELVLLGENFLNYSNPHVTHTVAF